MGLDVQLHNDPACFDLPEWRELVALDPERHVFSTPEWNRTWWEEFGTNKELLVLVFRRGDELVGIVPLYRKVEEGRNILRFVGGIDLTDYIGPICAPEDRAVIADALVDWLMTTDQPWDEFDAHNMPVPFHFAEYLVERADAKGLRFNIEEEETAALLMLRGSFDEYLAGLDSKERHELKRKRRRIGRDHPDASFRTSTEETLEADLKIFVDMHRGADGMKGHFMRPEIATFFERMAHSFMPLGWLRLDFLEIGETAIASTFGFELEDRFYLYNSAFDPDSKRLSPGMMLVSQLIEEYSERDFRIFDFLRGPERYKYKLGAEAVPLNNVRLLRAEG